MARLHFVAMSGMRGFMPNYACPTKTLKDAVESLVNVNGEIGGLRRQALRSEGYCDMPKGSGAEYCEVQRCNCDEPWRHTEGFDSAEKREWLEWMSEVPA